MKQFKPFNLRKIKKFYSCLPKKQIIISAIVLIFISVVSERFITQGTFLGYTVRQTSGQNKTINDSKKSEKTPLACSLVSDNDVAEIVESATKRVASNYEDRKEPKFLSVCSYITQIKPARSVSIVINDEKNEKSARDYLEDASQRKTSERVGKLGDESYFIQSSRQVIVRQKSRIFTITVSEPVEHSNVDVEKAALEIAKKALYK